MSWKQCPMFSVTVQGKVAAIFEEVKQKAKEEGVNFKGDATSGSFINKDGDVKGRYTVRKQTIHVWAEENMWVGTCKMVEEEFREWFKGK